MTIILTGGGSGGHITPILAVARELKQLRPDITLVYIGQRGDALASIPAQDAHIDTVYTVRAGKFRRYHGEGWRQVFDLQTMALNIRDGLYVLIGLFQSWRLLRRVRPQLVFTRGGFVSVPVALAASRLSIPYVTHDSDLTPSLANRILARRAALHTVALPKELYAYPPAKTITVGIPLAADYRFVDPALKAAYRQQIGIPATARLIFVTGGGNGAQRLNMMVAEAVTPMLAASSDLYVVNLTGKIPHKAMQDYYDTHCKGSARQQVILKDYITDVYRYAGAADVVITRAGATSLAELAVQGKACIVVPNDQLTGGHQTKNAQALAERHAVIMFEEATLQKQPDLLRERIIDLLENTAERYKLATALHEFAYPDAATQLAMVLLEYTSKQTVNVS